MKPGPSTRVVAALLFGSGFAALVYQTTWQRMFRLTFGATTAASAAVLAIFLGGLGLGGVLLGRRVERSARPLVYYGNLELGITALAALSPLLASAAHELYLALGGSRTLGGVGATVVRLLLTALVIGPAAVLMGGTLPAAARAVVRDDDHTRTGLALLYSLNTVGAVLGAVVGPLLLFGLLGNRMTLLGAACVNALVGVLARAIGRQLADVPVSPQSVASRVVDSVAPAESATASRLILAIAACVGFAFLALELVWYRVLTPLLGGTSVTFGLILACALAGIGLGGYLFSRRRAPATLALLALTLALEAVAVLVALVWGDNLAFLAAHLRATENLGYSYLLASWIFIAAMVVLPASIVSGYQFPVLFSLLGRGKALVGEQVGRIYAFNTLGTLAGSLLAGFVLLPKLGSVLLWRLLAQLLALLAVGCAVFAWRQQRQLKLLVAPVAVAALALALSASPGPGALFLHTPIGAGRLKVSRLSPNQVLEHKKLQENVTIWSRDGIESSIAMRVEDGLSFVVNGKVDGNVQSDGPTQAFVGLLPAALHGHVKQAMTIGLGTGMTAGLLGLVPGIERVEVAELEPQVLEVARAARLVNGSVLDNPRVEIHFGDGRELLLTSPHRYDLIVSEPSNPYRAGVAALFTREFYTAVASRLAPHGLFSQWMQGYEVDARAVAMVLETLGSVFPHVSMWTAQGADLILIGSFEPQVVDVERVGQALRQPFYANWMLRGWSMEGIEGLLAHHVAGPKELQELAAGLPSQVNTDDLNQLEFEFGRGVGDQRYDLPRDILAVLPAHRMGRPALTGEVSWQRVDDMHHRLEWTGAGDKPTPQARATALGCKGKMREAQATWPAGVEPTDLVEAWVVGWLEAASGVAAAEHKAASLERAGLLANALLLRSRLAEARQQPEQAVDLLLDSIAQLRREPLPLCDAAARALRRSQRLTMQVPSRRADLLRALAKGPLAVYRAELQRQYAMLLLSGGITDPELCLLGLGAMRKRPLWQGIVLQQRFDCLRAAGAPDAEAARNDLWQYLDNEPVRFMPGQQQQPQAEDPEL